MVFVVTTIFVVMEHDISNLFSNVFTNVFMTFCKFEVVSKMKAASVIVTVVQMSLNESMNKELLGRGQVDEDEIGKTCRLLWMRGQQ